ncbi:MAG: hypothetical protein ABIP55_02785 [Tepidisphaeraceae bacterium]
MLKLTQRLDRLQKAVDELRLSRCPLCLDGGVARMRINGQKQMEKDDAVYDPTWSCRCCGAAASEIDLVTPMGVAGKTLEAAD